MRGRAFIAYLRLLTSTKRYNMDIFSRRTLHFNTNAILPQPSPSSTFFDLISLLQSWYLSSCRRLTSNSLQRFLDIELMVQALWYVRRNVAHCWERYPRSTWLRSETRDVSPRKVSTSSRWIAKRSPQYYCRPSVTAVPARWSWSPAGNEIALIEPTTFHPSCYERPVSFPRIERRQRRIATVPSLLLVQPFRSSIFGSTQLKINIIPPTK